MTYRPRFNAIIQHDSVADISVTYTFTVAEGAAMETVDALTEHLTKLVGTAHVPAVEHPTEWVEVVTVDTGSGEEPVMLLSTDRQVMASRLIEQFGGDEYCEVEYTGDPTDLDAVLDHFGDEAGFNINHDQAALMSTEASK